MSTHDPEILERIRDLEINHGRHDERIKSVEDFAREMRSAISGMQVKLAGVVAIVTIGVELAFRFIK